MAGVGKLICSSTLLKFRSTKNQTANHLCLWRARYKIEEGPGAKEKDIQDAFGKIDKDKSGSINKEVPCILNNPDFQELAAINNLRLQELKLSTRFLAKSFGLKDVSAWLNQS